MRINDGGAAFPESGSRGKASGGEGMSLRDYFAAKAMAAYITSAGVVGGNFPSDKDIANWSYDTAEAMLNVREVKS